MERTEKENAKSNAAAKPPARSTATARAAAARRDPTKPSEIICFRCGKKGHMSSECTNEPIAKKRRPEQASVIFDMPPWKEQWQQFRRGRAEREQREREEAEMEEDIHGLEKTKGCAIWDSGATVMCSSTIAAEENQMQILRQNEEGKPTVSSSASMETVFQRPYALMVWGGGE